MPDPSSVIRLVVGVTAHRDIPAREWPRLAERVDAFFFGLRWRFPRLPLLLINPLADGGDRLVAQVARDMGIPMLVPLPFAREQYERDFDADSLREFRELTQGAEVRELPLAVGISEADIASPGPARDRQYAQLGMYVSSHCQILLALWDGRPSNAEGGTAQVIHFHVHNTMSGVAAQDIAPNLLADDDSDLVYHVPCGRMRRAGDPDDGEPGPPRWLTAGGTFRDDGMPPSQYEVVFEQMESFNDDIARHQDDIAANAETLLRDTPLPPPANVRRIDALFAHADWLALHFQRRRRTMLMATHAIALLMGLAFVLYSDWATEPAFVGMFLLFFMLGLMLAMIGRRRQWHRKYLDYRGLAEGLRVQLFWNLAGVDVPANSSFGYDSFLQKQDVELSWIRHAMRDAALARDSSHAPDPAWLPWVLRNWVGDREGRGGQLDYFRHGTAHRLTAYRTTRRFARLSLMAGIAGAAVLLVAGSRLGPGLQQALILAMGLLPLAAGIRETYSFKRADKELIKQFGFMTRLFESCRSRLELAGSDEESREILLALGRACLEEHAEWILLHRERPLEHETPG